MDNILKIFKKNNINNSLYFLPIITMFILTNLINLVLIISQNIVICSCIYVLLVFTANLMSELSGKRKTIQTLIICILVNTPLLFNINYHINGNKINGILLGSLISIIISICCGVSLFSKLKSIDNFHIKNLLSLLVCSVVDSITMSVFLLLNTLSINKITFIFICDLIFKFSYSLTMSFCLMCSIYLLHQVKNRSTSLN